jgi:hypothetical protein
MSIRRDKEGHFYLDQGTDAERVELDSKLKRTSPDQERWLPPEKIIRESPKRMQGIGDLVAKIAEPIANAIGMDKKNCGCQKRQEWLNRYFPFRKEGNGETQ